MSKTEIHPNVYTVYLKGSWEMIKVSMIFRVVD